MTARVDIAQRIAAGVAGYFQYVNASHLLAMPGEDTAQFVMCQILQAQQRYRLSVSAKPPNWKGKMRVDAALLPKAGAAAGWYGVAEVKWITSSHQRDTVRGTLLQDCARVASVDTTNLNAKFLVVGFIDGMLAKVFDNSHDPGPAEKQRSLLQAMLSRTTSTAAASKAHTDILACFPDYQSRVPACAQFTTGLEIELLARSTITQAGVDAGCVLVWQSNKRRGRPA